MKKCQNYKRPICVSFDGLDGPSRISINPYDNNYTVKIRVDFRVDKETAEKYITKKLTITDLRNMIKLRK